MLYIIGTYAKYKKTLTTKQQKLKYQQTTRTLLTSYFCAIVCIILCIMAASNDVGLTNIQLIACLLVIITVYIWIRDSMLIRRDEEVYNVLLDRLRCTCQVCSIVCACAYVLHYRNLPWVNITISVSIYLMVDITWYLLRPNQS